MERAADWGEITSDRVWLKNLNTNFPNMANLVSGCAHALDLRKKKSRAPYSLHQPSEGGKSFLFEQLAIKITQNWKMWSTLNTSRRSLKHLARVARHAGSLRSFGSVSSQVCTFSIASHRWFDICASSRFIDCRSSLSLVQRVITEDILSKNGFCKSRFYR